MQIGMVGLGRMGANLTRRLMRYGHEVIVHDVDPEAIRRLETEGASGAPSLEVLVDRLAPPRAVWLMVPAAAVDPLVDRLHGLLEPDDVVIDGGNSHHRDDHRRAAALRDRGIHYLDVGTSGGVFGLERGFCLMIGGEPEIVARLEPVFRALAPGVDAAPRTPGRGAIPSPAEAGYLHCGPTGAGHFVKMVHNGIEYGMMAALAEGLNLLRNADVGEGASEADAETAPLAEPDLYRYRLEPAEIVELWRRGSVIASWLLDLLAAELARDPTLGSFSGRVADSGEGRWTVAAAVELGVPVHVLSAALFDRFASRSGSDFANRALSAMRRAFGGHEER